MTAEAAEQQANAQRTRHRGAHHRPTAGGEGRLPSRSPLEQPTDRGGAVRGRPGGRGKFGADLLELLVLAGAKRREDSNKNTLWNRSAT